MTGVCYSITACSESVNVHIKIPNNNLNKRFADVSTAGFLSRYLNGCLPYVRRHITVNKNVLSASLNKTFPSGNLKP